MSRFDENQALNWGLEALVVEAARDHIISRRKAATLLGIQDYQAREDFFARHGLTNEYTLEMLDLDFKAIDRAKE